MKQARSLTMNKNKLFSILEMSDIKLMKYLHSSVKKKHYDIYTDDDNYFFACPKTPSNHVMLVSHIDTVRKRGKINIVEANGIVQNSGGILGADDRAGVYAILEIADRCIKEGKPLPYLLFTNYEECGGLGVRQFCKDKITKNVESDIFLMIELDRRGVNEAVYYTDPENEVKKIVSSVGYKEDFGTYSDVATLSNHNDIAHVNLSIGYFNEHTAYEILVLSVVDFAIENVMSIMPMVKRQYGLDFSKTTPLWYGNYGRKSYSGKTKSLSQYKKKEKVSVDAPICPECFATGEDIIEYKGVGCNYCQECGAYFDRHGEVIHTDQKDEFVWLEKEESDLDLEMF